MIQEFTQEVKNTVTEILQGVHTSIPGKIVKYDAAKCTAEILPYGKFKKPNGEFMDFPQLNHVPILFPQSCGQDFAIVYPINPGDECQIHVQEQTLDIWRGAGASSDNDLRFDFTNAVAIMGMFSNPQPLAQEAQSGDKLIIQKSGHRIAISPDGVKINAPTTTINGDLSVTGEIVADGGISANGDMSSSGNITTQGNVNIQGNASITGTLTLAGINMNTHTHDGVLAGSDDTGQPK